MSAGMGTKSGGTEGTQNSARQHKRGKLVTMHQSMRARAMKHKK